MEQCAKCHVTIHPNFAGYHKCGYANCPICKMAITNPLYWGHIRTHPGHENDAPQKRTFSRNLDRNQPSKPPR